MKAYVTTISGPVLASWMRPGVISDFDERIVCKVGIPQTASIIAMRVPEGKSVVELLWISKELGDLPEAVDLWQFAERSYVTHIKGIREREEAKA